MGLRIRRSPQTFVVLEALLERPSQWHYGYSLSGATEISSGTLYPILMRLRKLRWLETRWEEPRAGHPPRHLYRLTGNGRAWALEELRAARRAAALKPALSRA